MLGHGELAGVFATSWSGVAARRSHVVATLACSDGVGVLEQQSRQWLDTDRHQVATLRPYHNDPMAAHPTDFQGKSVGSCVAGAIYQLFSKIS